MSKGRSKCICLSAIVIDYVFKLGKSRYYYPKAFQEECVYKKKKERKDIILYW